MTRGRGQREGKDSGDELVPFGRLQPDTTGGPIRTACGSRAQVRGKDCLGQVGSVVSGTTGVRTCDP